VKVTLPKEVLDSLPSPDSEGLVRVQASLRLSEGSAEIVEINDQPVPVGDEETDDAMPMPELPDLGPAEADIYG
jgi:hypothetical protein